MIRITKRKILFEGKKEDYSLTEDHRVQGDKKMLDVISEFAICENEKTIFNIYRSEELKTTFSQEDFNNENVDLTLKQASANAVKIEILENLVKTAKNEKTDKQELVLIDRVINLVY